MSAKTRAYRSAQRGRGQTVFDFGDIRGGINQSAPYLVRNDEIYNYYVNTLLKIASMPFEWSGLEDTAIDRWFMETCLVYNGTIAVYEAGPARDIVATNWFQQSGFDLYGMPNRISGTTNFKADIPVEGDFAIGFDNQANRLMLASSGGLSYGTGSSTTIQAILFHAKRLYEQDQTWRSNLRWQRKPFVLKVSDDGKTLKSARTFFQANETFDPVIEVSDKNNIADAVSTIQMGVDYNSELLRDRQELFNAALNELGISGNVSSQKKERLISDEVKLNHQADSMQLKGRLLARQELCEKVNSLFGTDIWCEVSDQMVDENSAVDTDPVDYDTRGRVAPPEKENTDE